MKLVSFSITNFRSITKAHKLPISNSTILIGKNNEGKSNILNALAIAMELIRMHGYGALPPLRRPQRYRRRGLYEWERDFPIQLQTNSSPGASIFRLEFELNDAEIEEFKKEIKSNLNGTLPIEIHIGTSQNPEFLVIKKGRGSKTLQKKSQIISQFIGQRIDFTYIPAVRTSDAAVKVVEEMLSDELSVLEENKEYIKALEKITELQQPILDKISEKITVLLQQFIPQIKEVKVRVSDEERYKALRRSCEVIIDDGTATSIERKGDGVKSLAAISLLRGQKQTNRASVLALEEPESHLHPSAIHRLKDVIYELSLDHQVVVSTHSPLFVDRKEISSNILIDSNKAKPAEHIQEIRDLLGVKASDNLTHAKLALIVEGEDDKESLSAIFANCSQILKNALNNGTLVVEPLYGAGNLSYKISVYQSVVCDSHVLVDNDVAGREAIEKAEEEGILKVADYHYVVCNGMGESEFEDCLNSSIYSEAINREYGVDINGKSFRNNSSKWSQRMKETFLSQGKRWTQRIEKQLKNTVSQCVKTYVERSLNEHKRSSIDALVSSLESKLTE